MAIRGPLLPVELGVAARGAPSAEALSGIYDTKTAPAQRLNCHPSRAVQNTTIGHVVQIAHCDHNCIQA